MAVAPSPPVLDVVCPAGARVEAGGLIARGPAHLCPAAADGAVALGLPGGGTEVRAATGGRVTAGPAGLGVDDRTEVEGHLTRTAGRSEVSVAGTIVVEGGVGAGVVVRATGDIVVAGPVERAMLVAGGAVLLDGPASGSEIQSGLMGPLTRHVRGRLRLVPRALEHAADAADDLMAAARRRGVTLGAGHALGLGIGATWPALTDRLRELDRLCRRLAEDLPAAVPGLAGDVRDLLRAVESGEGEGAPDLARALARRLRAVGSDRSRHLDAVRAREIRGSLVLAGGAVVVTGAGVRESRITTPGDVSVPQGHLWGGELALGGQLRARTLGRPGALTEVRILVTRPETPGLERDRVVAGSVQGPLEVRAPLGGLAVGEGGEPIAVYQASGVPLLRTDLSSRARARQPEGGQRSSPRTGPPRTTRVPRLPMVR